MSENILNSLNMFKGIKKCSELSKNVESIRQYIKSLNVNDCLIAKFWKKKVFV